MKSLSPELLEFMRTHKRCAMANLYTLTLGDGTVAYWTDWHADLTWNGITYKAPTPNPGHGRPDEASSGAFDGTLDGGMA